MRALTAAFFLTGLLAWPAGVNARDAPVTLRVKPLLCITDKPNQHCALSIMVWWTSDKSGHYCLYNDHVSEPLECWSEHVEGTFTEDRVIARSFSYWLTAPDIDYRLAEQVLEVMSAESSDRRQKRRSRHAWSVL